MYTIAVKFSWSAVEVMFDFNLALSYALQWLGSYSSVCL